MRKLDQRGVAAFEFCVVAVALFTLMFAIFDLGRYMITMQSLRALANAGVRATIIGCYTPNVIANASPSTCTDINTYLPDAQKQVVAPFLYTGGLSPTLSTTQAGSALTVTASQPDFKMLFKVWGTALNAPSASTQIPF